MATETGVGVLPERSSEVTVKILTLEQRRKTFDDPPTLFLFSVLSSALFFVICHLRILR